MHVAWKTKPRSIHLLLVPEKAVAVRKAAWQVLQERPSQTEQVASQAKGAALKPVVKLPERQLVETRRVIRVAVNASSRKLRKVLRIAKQPHAVIKPGIKHKGTVLPRQARLLAAQSAQHVRTSSAAVATLAEQAGMLSEDKNPLRLSVLPAAMR